MLWQLLRHDSVLACQIVDLFKAIGHRLELGRVLFESVAVTQQLLLCLPELDGSGFQHLPDIADCLGVVSLIRHQLLQTAQLVGLFGAN